MTLRPGRLLLALALVAAAVAAFATTVQGGWAVDYLAFATGGRALATNAHHLYDVSVQASAQASMLGYRPPANPNFPALFVNPPFVALLMEPFAALSLQGGTDLFCIVLLLAMATSAFMFRTLLPESIRGLDRTAVATWLGVPAAGAYAVLIGQWAPILVLALALALLFLRRDNELAAGAVTAALLVKPQLVWLVPVGILMFRRWRLAAGFFAAATVLACLSLLAVGVDGLKGYVHLLTSFVTAGAGNTQSIPGLVDRALGSGVSVSAVALVSGVVGLIVLAVVGRRHRLTSEQLLATLLLVSVATTPHVNLQDLGVLSFSGAVFLDAAPKRVLCALAALNIAALPTYVWGLPVAGVVVLLSVAALVYAALGRDSALTTASVA